jgi:hypothetical protein
MTLDVSTRIVTKPSAEPLRIAADLCVVGSGAAGSMAALTAARLGRSVVLVDAMPALGGQAVGGLLGTLCGFYANGPNPPRVVYGAVTDMLEHLAEAGTLSARRARNTVIYQFEEHVLARWIERSLVEAGVKVLLGATLRGAARTGRRVTRLHLATRWGDVEVEAQGFVDASGDATVAWHAGLPVREPVAPVFGSQMFQIEGIDEAEFARFDRWEVEAVLRDNADAYGLRRKDGFVFAQPGTGIGLANMTHIPTPTEPVGASMAGLDGKDQADRVMALLRDKLPAAMGKARIRAYGLPGIRQTRWIAGTHHLTTDEVRAGTRFDDAVARCTWPVELHNRAEGVHWEEFGDDHMHWVPLGSMTPADADNLVAAGRCVDGDVAALASIRVIGPCMAMGQAAAHALDLAGAGSVHQLDLGALQDRVRDNLERADHDPWTAGL